MDNMQWYDWLRIANSGMLVFVLYKEGRRFHKLRPKMSKRLVDIYWVYLMSMFLIFYGSLEAVKLDSGGGPRSALALVVVCVAFKTALQRAPVDLENDQGMT